MDDEAKADAILALPPVKVWCDRAERRAVAYLRAAILRILNPSNPAPTPFGPGKRRGFLSRTRALPAKPPRLGRWPGRLRWETLTEYHARMRKARESDA